jgi:hypothetical protein
LGFISFQKSNIALAPQFVPLISLFAYFWVPHQGKALPSFYPTSKKAYVELMVVGKG